MRGHVFIPIFHETLPQARPQQDFADPSIHTAQPVGGCRAAAQGGSAREIAQGGEASREGGPQERTPGLTSVASRPATETNKLLQHRGSEFPRMP